MFRDLDPPPHGLALLRARLHRRRRQARWALAIAPAAALALLLVVIVTRQAPAFDDALIGANPAAVRYGAAPPVGVRVMVAGVPVAALPLSHGVWLVP